MFPQHWKILFLKTWLQVSQKNIPKYTPGRILPSLNNEGSYTPSQAILHQIICDFVPFAKIIYGLVLSANCFMCTNAFSSPIKYINYLRRRLNFILCLFLLSIQETANARAWETSPRAGGLGPRAVGFLWVGDTTPSLRQHPVTLIQPTARSKSYNLTRHESSPVLGGPCCLAPSHRCSQETEVAHTRPYNAAGALI